LNGQEENLNREPSRLRYFFLIFIVHYFFKSQTLIYYFPDIGLLSHHSHKRLVEMHIELYVPTTNPTKRAKLKLMRTGPPHMKSAITGNTVVSVVFIVRDNV